MSEIDRLKKNIFRLYGFAFFQSFLIVIPTIVPFWQNKGLSLTQIFILQGIFGGALIAFDVPAGYLADFFGRRKALILGSIISAISFQVLCLGQTFEHFVVYEVIIGLGLSLQSGCDIAILYNTIDKLKKFESNNGKGSFDENGKLQKETRTARFLGYRLMTATGGEGIASLLGGLFALYSLDLPAYVNAATGWITVYAAWRVYEPEGDRLPRQSHWKNFCSIGRSLFGHSRLLTLAIFCFVFYGFATYCAVWSFQPYWSSRGMGVSTFGYLWALNCFCIAIVGRFAHRIEMKIGSALTIVIISVMPVVGYLGMGFTPGLYGLLFSLAFPICRGLNFVLFQDIINTRVPPEMRATANSIGSLGMRVLFIVFGPLLGAVMDQHGPSAGLQILGFVYLVGMFLIPLPLLMQKKHFSYKRATRSV